MALPISFQKEAYLTARVRRRQRIIRIGMSQKGTNQDQHTTETIMIHMGDPMVIGMTMMMTIMESMTVCLCSHLHVSRIPYAHSSLVSDGDSSDYYY